MKGKPQTESKDRKGHTQVISPNNNNRQRVNPKDRQSTGPGQKKHGTMTHTDFAKNDKLNQTYIE